jgi:Protein of unknown function (DUF2958)
MKLLHRRDRERLIEKGRRRQYFAYRSGRGDPPLPLTDPHLLPTVLLYMPDQGGIWLLSDLHPQNHDRAYGLRYLSRGIPEIGYFSLSEITATHRGVRRVSRIPPQQIPARLCLRAVDEGIDHAAEYPRHQAPHARTLIAALSPSLLPADSRQRLRCAAF